MIDVSKWILVNPSQNYGINLDVKKKSLLWMLLRILEEKIIPELMDMVKQKDMDKDIKEEEMEEDTEL
jgi:hypothetical protein